MANKNPILPESNVGKKYKRTITDPRVHLFKQYYVDPKSESFMNIFQSAIRAGYSEQYASNISVQTPKWWIEFTTCAEVRRAKMLNKAENNIDEFLDAPSETSDDKKLKLQASTFISERLGKDFYSTRTELTDKGGRRLFRGEDRDARKIELGSLFKGVQSAPSDAK